MGRGGVGSDGGVNNGGNDGSGDNGGGDDNDCGYISRWCRRIATVSCV